METNQLELKCAEIPTPEGPSLDFIRAVAEFLETDPDDILAEIGYVHPDDVEAAVG